ncbi:MAG: hypothetical protein ABIZ69_14430 [Ilumatobacteraceae bacterium]
MLLRLGVRIRRSGLLPTILIVLATGCASRGLQAESPGSVGPQPDLTTVSTDSANAGVDPTGGSVPSAAAPSGAPTTWDVGDRPFSASSPFNTPTAAGTEWVDNDALHVLDASYNEGSTMHWWVNQGAPIWVGTDADPVWTLDMPSFVDQRFNRNRPATTITGIHAPEQLSGNNDDDNVLFIVNGTTYYEVWLAQIDHARHVVTGTAWATGDIVNGPGAGTIGNNDGVRASNFSWSAGVITGADITAGTIDHALEVSLTSFQLASLQWTAPATAPERQGYGTIQMGAKIGIPAGIAKPAGLSPIGSMVFDALQKYGAYAGDYVGGPWPTLYTDPLTVTDREVEPLFAFWDHDGSADMEKIDPLLRIAA